ncbi:MAG: hypothetical protein ACJAR1_001870 [Rubritalea sp.]|jgi:hypothetical protein
MKINTKCLLTLAAVALSAPLTNAAISVTGTSANILEDLDNNGAYTNTISDWSLSGGNTVVVYFSGENTTGMTAKYGTQDLIVVQGVNGTTGNDHISAIAYIINPTLSTADLAVSWAAGGNSENMITAISLGGVGSVVASDSTNTGNLSFGYTTTLDGGFVVGSASNNNFQGNSPTVSSSNLDTDVFNGAISGNSSAINTYGVIDLAGTYTDTYSGGLVGSSVVFEAAAIPEPSSTALLGLGGLALILRRRR